MFLNFLMFFYIASPCTIKKEKNCRIFMVLYLFIGWFVDEPPREEECDELPAGAGGGQLVSGSHPQAVPRHWLPAWHEAREFIFSSTKQVQYTVYTEQLYNTHTK